MHVVSDTMTETKASWTNERGPRVDDGAEGSGGGAAVVVKPRARSVPVILQCGDS